MKVFSIPFVEGNPYQKNLHRELVELGCEVSEFISIRKFGWRESLSSVDVLHLHWPPKCPGISPWELKGIILFFLKVSRIKIFGKRLVWTVHNEVPHESAAPEADMVVNRILAHLADCLICHSPDAKERISKAYKIAPGKVIVIPHGNYIGSYPVTVDRQEARRILGLDPSQRVLLFFGLIRPYKGVKELIEIFRCVNPHNMSLVIAGKPGGGISLEDLKEASAGADQVLLHPVFIPDDQVQHYMTAADACAFPYLSSLTSGALMLAMSFGKPCLVFDTPFTRYLLGEDGGFFAENQDFKALGEAIRAFSEADDSLLDTMGKRNYATALEFDWRGIAEETLRTYRGGDSRKVGEE